MRSPINKQEAYKLRLIAYALMEINPMIYKACESAVTPLLEDTACLPFVCSQIKLVKGDPDGDNMPFYCAVILRLYSPVHLHMEGARLTTGLRDIFSEQFNFNNAEMWNHYFIPVRSHMKNARFASAVNSCAFSIMGNLKSTGQIQMNCPDFAPTPAKFENGEKLGVFSVKNEGYAEHTN